MNIDVLGPISIYIKANYYFEYLVPDSNQFLLQKYNFNAPESFSKLKASLLSIHSSLVFDIINNIRIIIYYTLIGLYKYLDILKVYIFFTLYYNKYFQFDYLFNQLIFRKINKLRFFNYTR